MTRSLAIKLLAGIAVALVIGYGVWRTLPDYLGHPEDRRSEEHLSKVAAELNRGLPAMLDKETELMGARGAPGTLLYSYRLVNFSAEQVNHEKFAAAAKQQVVQGACNRPETRDDFLTKGVILRYSYYDKERRHIATVDVTPADCGL